MMIDYVFHISTSTEFSLSKCIQKFQALGMVNSAAIGHIGWYSYLSKSAWNKYIYFLCHKTQALICDFISIMFEQMWPLTAKTWLLWPSATNLQCSNQGYSVSLGSQVKPVCDHSQTVVNVSEIGTQGKLFFVVMHPWDSEFVC